MLKFLILLLYCNRPILIKNALQAIAESTYDNYEVAIIDDSPECPAKPIVEQHFPQLLSKCKFYETNDTKESKLARGSSIFGKFCNQALEESDSDVFIMNCDDDAIYPTYLENLNKFYQENLDVNYAYSHIVLFNPLVEDFNEVKKRTGASHYLNHTGPINPFCQVDSSQVSFRRQETLDAGIRFAYPMTRNLDADIYQKSFNVFGHCIWTGCIGQFKGWDYGRQLGSRNTDFENFE